MKKNLGFTLIELLVVISIITLLSSVVFTAVGDAKDKAQQANYREHFKHLIIGLELYKEDTGSYPPEAMAPKTLTRAISDTPEIENYITDLNFNPSIIGNIYYYTNTGVVNNHTCFPNSSEGSTGYIFLVTGKTFLNSSHRSDLNFRGFYHTGSSTPLKAGYYCINNAAY